MSAYVVSHTHIDAIVTAGLLLHRSVDGPLRWYDRRPSAEELDAVYVPGEAIPAGSMSWHREHHCELTPSTAGRVGAMLLAENVRSVNHRYAEDDWEEPYVFDALPARADMIDPREVLQALRGFEYQACEHPRWETSEAHAFIRALEARMIDRLCEGAGHNTWAIDDRHIWDPVVTLQRARDAAAATSAATRRARRSA